MMPDRLPRCGNCGMTLTTCQAAPCRPPAPSGPAWDGHAETADLPQLGDGVCLRCGGWDPTGDHAQTCQGVIR